jgi:hypothetical protein
MYRQKRVHDEAASCDAEESLAGEETGQLGRCRREEESEAVESVVGTCWKTCRPYLTC